MAPRASHTLLVALLILSGIELQGQPLNAGYKFRQLNVQNGLAQNIVYHFLQDTRGYMWIGTHNGLTQYDGSKTTNFLHNDQLKNSIGGNFITSLLEDSSQQIWIGNENGFDLYNRPTNSFVHFGVDRPDGTKDNTFCVLLGFPSREELWFLDTKTKSIRSFDMKNRKSSFIGEINGNNAILYKGADQTIHVWTSYDKGTTYQVYRDRKLQTQHTFFSGKESPVQVPGMFVIHVLQQSDTVAWLSTDKGLVKLNPATKTYQLYNKWINGTVRELRYTALSPKGQLWVGTGPDGIYIFDPPSQQFVANYRNNKSDPFTICSDNIVSLYFDKTGHAWCGSYGNGSSYTGIENSFFANHLSQNEMKAWNGNNSVAWLDFDKKNNLWCMLQNMQGFWMLDNSFNVKEYRRPLTQDGKRFDNGFSKLLFDDKGNAWCATNIGLYLYRPETNRMQFIRYDLINTDMQGSIWLRDLIKLNDGSLLFSTFAGLYRLTTESGRNIVKPINFLDPTDYIGFGPLFQDENDFIYVRSLSEFFYILKPLSNGRDFTLVKTNRFSPLVNQYFSEKGDSLVYLATTDGVYHINKHSFEIEKEAFSRNLPSRNVNSLFLKDKMFWIFGEKGLSTFDKVDNSSRLYSYEDGLPANEFNRAALCYSPSGKCVAGTTNGLVAFIPQRHQFSNHPPGAQIAGIYINDVPDTTIANTNEITSLYLTHRQNTFSFDFAAIAFEHASECNFEYKLDGYDEDWIKSGTAHYTRYSRIPPGDYVFHLRAIDASGKASPFLKTLNIFVQKAFFQTTAFRIAVLLFLAGIGWLLIKWHLNYSTRQQRQEIAKLQAIEKERTRIASDMHDDLGAGLSRIKFLSESMRSKIGMDEQFRKEIEKISSYSDEMAEKMGEIVWALNEKNDTVADLVAFTRSYAIEYLSSQNIHCTVDTPLNLPATFITGEMRQNIFLSVKECLHNVVKHSGASKVYFAIHLDHGIQIVIRDNGRGIDWKAVRPFSNGLQNIERRMSIIKGNAAFTNTEGTKVTLTVPLHL